MAKLKKTNSESPDAKTQHPRLVRFVFAHTRLLSSIAIGLLVFLLLPKDGLPVPRGFFAWDVGVICFLASVYWMVSHSDAAIIRQQSAMQDEGRNLVLIGAIGAVVISIAVILMWLSGGTSAGSPRARDVALVFLTIPLSWVFIHTIFMLHYAREFYAEHRGTGGGLRFPGDEQPNYWDFVYFAFGVGMAAQVADVAVTSKPLRHIVLIHSIVSFVFNVTLIAMAVSIVGGAISTQ
ncbi:MAG TPA: DUF1345 domain-containing protein [Methyloceanibacter sp.]|nr:DUF1345 domain-containing protein [Methyloceanibacter sp.]